MLDQPDTLVAVFEKITVGVNELGAEFDFAIFPNPADNYLIFNYTLESSAVVNLSLYSVLGEKVQFFAKNSGSKASGNYSEKLDLSQLDIKSGLYIIVAEIENKQMSFKINIVR